MIGILSGVCLVWTVYSAILSSTATSLQCGNCEARECTNSEECRKTTATQVKHADRPSFTREEEPLQAALCFPLCP